MIGTYIAKVEKKINELVCNNSNMKVECMSWEQWLSKIRPTNKFWNKPNYYYTYICLGTLLILPGITYGIGFILTNFKFYLLYTIFVIIAFAIYIFLYIYMSLP